MSIKIVTTHMMHLQCPVCRFACTYDFTKKIQDVYFCVLCGTGIRVNQDIKNEDQQQ